MSLMQSLLRCFLSCRKFRTYFLIVLALILLSQSFIVYYILYNVREAENPSQFISSPVFSAVHIPDKELKVKDNRKFSCDIVSKTAISAIRRASTQACKVELSEVACKLKLQQLFPKRLPNYCLRKDSNPGSSLGCYEDNDQQRQLTGYGARIQNLTVEKCIDLCTQSAFPYSGVRSGKECYCGTQKPSKDHLLTSSYCNVPCDGLSSQYCGGTETIEVFDTGVPSRDSAKLQDPVVDGSVNIAFILTLNGRSLRQVTRLLRIIYRPHHTYIIHVDARQDYLFRNLLQLESNFSNIRLTRERQSTIWGGVSLLDVLLQVMKELLNMNRHWDFVFNMSESDFPLKPVEQLEHFLAANSGRNFLKSHGRQARQFIHKQGLDRVFHQCERRMWRVGDRALPSGIRFDGGSDWFGLSRDFVEYIVRSTDPLVHGLRQLFYYTLLPAESFFHVLVLNSKFCDSYADNNLRMTLWRRSQGCLCQHRAVVDWCGCSPMVFRTSDWTNLATVAEKNNVFFARKFESVIDQSVINRLEEMQLSNTTISFQGWDSFWENVYDFADVTPPSRALLAVGKSVVEESLARTKADKTCSIKIERDVSVTSYFHRDHYKGDLFLYDIQLRNQRLQMEAFVTPLTQTSFFSTTHSLLRTLQVGSDYDPKEQTLRNRIGVLSQFSKPTALFKWSGHSNFSSSTNVHFVWFDPSLKVRAVHDVNVTDSSKAGSQNLDVDPPLASGVWTLMVVLGTNKLATTDFLIVPLADDQPTKPTIENSSHSKWETYLNLDPESKRKRMNYGSLQTSDRLAQFDSLVTEFYAVEDFCFVGQPSSCRSYFPWPVCSATQWSSLSPDPKSVLMK